MNRAQKRAKQHGRRPGESYAEYLARERQIREAIDKSVHDTSVEIVADQKRQIMLWEAVVALNRRFGYAEKRAVDFMETLAEVDDELRDIAREDGRYVATEHLRKECSNIMRRETQLIHMDEIKRAKECSWNTGLRIWKNGCVLAKAMTGKESVHIMYFLFQRMLK